MTVEQRLGDLGFAMCLPVLNIFCQVNFQVQFSLGSRYYSQMRAYIYNWPTIKIVG